MTARERERRRTLDMVETCGRRQVADSIVPDLGSAPYEAEPPNHETLPAASDVGVEGAVPLPPQDTEVWC